MSNSTDEETGYTMHFKIIESVRNKNELFAPIHDIKTY